ncbi:MAG: LacI family transcriptional regulator, partial [Fastidiosipila sp.]|nr:LacI family transcriptional regulator [Fastidiosipila sp.]
MPTIKDVAGLAGVSIGTVSNFINNTRPVSRETAAKVKDAIEVLNYTPNMSARNLKANITSDIGLIIPSFNDTYYVQVFQGIECAFQNSEYSVHLSFSNDIPDLEDKIAREYLERRVSGLILISCQPDQWRFYYNNFTSRGIPIVLIDRDIRGLDTSLVTFDNHAIICQMCHALLAEGKQNLVLISGPEKFDCEARCINGFKEAHSKMEVPLTKDAVVNCNMSKEEAFRRTLQMFRTNKPDAIISTSES